MGLLTVAANPMRELGAVLFTDNQYTQAVPFTITGVLLFKYLIIKTVL